MVHTFDAFANTQSSTTYDFNVPDGIEARYVRVEQTGYMAIAEIEVFGSEIISGSSTSSSVVNPLTSSTTGNDYLIGRDGADVFEFASIDGTDTIVGFEDGTDHISITDGATGFSNLTISASGSDTLVTASNGNTITLEDVNSALITQDDFIFA